MTDSGIPDVFTKIEDSDIKPALPLHELRRLAGDLQEMIAELESGPRREIDIAYEHNGDPTLIARVLRTSGDPESGNWYRIERIFCSREHCPRVRTEMSDIAIGAPRTVRSPRHSPAQWPCNTNIEWLRTGVCNGIAYTLEDIPDGDKST